MLIARKQISVANGLNTSPVLKPLREKKWGYLGCETGLVKDACFGDSVLKTQASQM